MRPTTINYTMLAIGLFILFLLPDAVSNLFTPHLRGSLVYACTSFSGADSLCRIVLHYRVSHAVAREDRRCTLLGAGTAAAVAAVRI